TAAATPTRCSPTPDRDHPTTTKPPARSGRGLRRAAGQLLLGGDSSPSALGPPVSGVSLSPSSPCSGCVVGSGLPTDVAGGLPPPVDGRSGSPSPWPGGAGCVLLAGGGVPCSGATAARRGSSVGRVDGLPVPWSGVLATSGPGLPPPGVDEVSGCGVVVVPDSPASAGCDSRTLSGTRREGCVASGAAGFTLVPSG